MYNSDLRSRNFLFLQGPPGPFFWELGLELARHGFRIFRVNLNGGDRRDWPSSATNYRGRANRWPLFVDNFLRENDITDIVLFGDCRPLHRSTIRIAQLRGVHIHVFEEGYIRPDWMTLERDGVNGHSPIERDPKAILEQANELPDLPELPRITADFRRRAKDSFRYYLHVLLGRVQYPFARSHRGGSLVIEAFGWVVKFLFKPKTDKKLQFALKRIAEAPYFLFPLQLSKDFQIREHSAFGSMDIAAEYVIESFARYCPPNISLVVKEHPLDATLASWNRRITKLAKKFKVEHRVVHIAGGDLDDLVRGAMGMVCVNSTSGTLALEAGLPVAVLGDAVYDVSGLTHRAHLDWFWRSPKRPDMQLYRAFKKMMHAKCLIRGGVASQSAIKTLVANSAERIIASTYSDNMSEREFRPLRYYG